MLSGARFGKPGAGCKNLLQKPRAPAMQKAIRDQKQGLYLLCLRGREGEKEPGHRKKKGRDVFFKVYLNGANSAHSL